MHTVPAPFPETSAEEDIHGKIAAGLATRGYAIVNPALPADLPSALYNHVTSLDPAAFKRAGIGRATDHQIDQQVRSDTIHWLDRSNDAVQDYFAWIESLRLELNRRLFLGLFDYECHYACYPPGAFYRQHVDAFKGDANRVVTTVLYLNPRWTPQDGGELLLYTAGHDSPIESIAPEFGTMVLFLSEEFPHEVVTARQPRYSIAGWFRVNNTLGNSVDPPR